MPGNHTWVSGKLNNSIRMTKLTKLIPSYYVRIKKNARDANVRRKKNVFDWMQVLRTQFQGNHELKNYEDTNSGSPNSMKIFLWTQALGIILNSDSGIWALTSSVAIRPRDHMSTSRHLQRRHNDSSGMSWCCFRLCSAWKWFLEGRDLELS